MQNIEFCAGLPRCCPSCQARLRCPGPSRYEAAPPLQAKPLAVLTKTEPFAGLDDLVKGKRKN